MSTIIKTHDMPALEDLQTACKGTEYHIGKTPTDYEDIRIICDGCKGATVSFILHEPDELKKYEVELDEYQLENLYERCVYDFFDTLEWAQEEHEARWDDVSEELASRIAYERELSHAEYMEDLRFARSLDFA